MNSPGLVPDVLEKVREQLRAHSPVLIAYSGGVDSATLLAMAAGDPAIQALAVIADSPSLPRRSLDAALEEAKRIGIPVQILLTEELLDPNYASNPFDRCYFCKAELFRRMEALASSGGFRGLAYGENADDVAADRPGSRAAQEFSVIAPLRHAGLGKADVRRWAAHFGLRAADSPAQPCLSSRIRHGVPVSAQALSMIEAGESFLQDLGFRICRVRYLGTEESTDTTAAGPRALVQVAAGELHFLNQKQSEISRVLREIGFSVVEFDSEGYRGPSLA